MIDSTGGVLKYLDADAMGLSDNPQCIPLLPSNELIDFDGNYPDNNNTFTYPCLYSAIVRSCKNKPEYHFVELGTFKGKSAFYMGKEIEQHMKTTDTKIIFDTVDTFEGSVEHQDYLKEEKISLHDITQTQLESVTDYVNVIKSDSAENASRYEDESLDFVFIDASHDEESVKADLAYWMPRMKENGVIAGDDVNNEGVANAVKWFFDNEKLEIVGRQWMVDLGQ